MFSLAIYTLHKEYDNLNQFTKIAINFVLQR